MFTVRQIVQITAGELLPEGDSQQNISSVHFDSRKIEDGSLFVALKGGARDGHRFVGDAKKNGAVAALISDADAVKAEHKEGLSLILVSDTEEAFQQLASAYRDQLTTRMIAITGSNGKTTTKDMTWHLLAKKHNVFKTFKNLNNHLGLPLSVLKIKAEDDFAVL
jgi:UDP-N-acetylmuramoyl-tripeptide--D-alanyl-D-alanine ligase